MLVRRDGTVRSCDALYRSGVPRYIVPGARESKRRVSEFAGAAAPESLRGPMRRLVLMRHAKAVRPDVGLDDFDRRLEPRGREEAARTAWLLADLGVAPDVALVSPARRALDTWRLIAPVLPAPQVDIDDELYLADTPVLLARLAAHDTAETVILVAHNPGLKDVAYTLMGEGPHDVRARASLADGLPTSCAIVLGLDGGPTPGAARLAAFVAPPRESDEGG